jgi:hypothetical protein
MIVKLKKQRQKNLILRGILEGRKGSKCDARTFLFSSFTFKFMPCDDNEEFILWKNQSGRGEAK